MPKCESKENCRKFPRMAVDLDCAIVRAGASGAAGRKVRVKARNVGLGGLSIETGAALTLGESLQIFLMIDGQSIEATGRVAYVKPAPRGGIENGVEFTRILDEHRDFLLAVMLLQKNSGAE